MTRPTFVTLSNSEAAEVRKCVDSVGFRLLLGSMDARAKSLAHDIALGLLESDPGATAQIGMQAATAARNEDMKAAAGMMLAIKAIQQEISTPQIKLI